MNSINFPENIEGTHIHLVGAKGTGMTALAEILHSRGAHLTGSDVADTFYTDSILHSLGISLFEDFNAHNVPDNVDLMIYSAAYSRETNPELIFALQRKIPVFSYPEALGALSLHSHSAGIAGVHGKTTTTAMAGILASALSLPATVLAGSALANFDGHCTFIAGNDYFIAETCEYRKHFMNFKPSWIVLTAIESDHQDYFPTYESIRDAFLEYVLSLPAGGTLIFCADQKGAVEVAEIALQQRKDINFVEYGFSAHGRYRIKDLKTNRGENIFHLRDESVPMRLHVPGQHLVLDAAAAIALIESIFTLHAGHQFGQEQWSAISDALSTFRGSKRRSEVLGEFSGILFIDDYGHHPTAIKATLDGIKKFWPRRRIIIDFMSHTYTRTIALLDEFVASLDLADSVLLHKIYTSAREQPIPGFSGKVLYEKLQERRPELQTVDLEELAVDSDSEFSMQNFVAYSDNPLNAFNFLTKALREGDIFITMGAGDNWKLGKALTDHFEKASSGIVDESRGRQS